MNERIAFKPLPDISFVGGGVFCVDFHMKDEEGIPFDASEYTASFCISSRHGDGVFYGETEICSDEDGVLSVLHASIPSKITKELCGEYVYQISLTDEDEFTYEPLQGRMRVAPFICEDTSMEELGRA